MTGADLASLQTQDQDPIRTITNKMELFCAAKASADCLALNDVLSRHQKAIEQCYETLLDVLMQHVRSSTGANRSDAVDRLDAVIDMAEAFFGADYAALLRRSRKNAIAA
jgi:hypothetical protein